MVFTTILKLPASYSTLEANCRLEFVVDGIIHVYFDSSFLGIGSSMVRGNKTIYITEERVYLSKAEYHLLHIYGIDVSSLRVSAISCVEHLDEYSSLASPATLDLCAPV